jgi:hypothetical protein
MNPNLFFTLMLTASLFSATNLSAQRSAFTEENRRESARLKAVYQARSDSAFQAALPAIRAEVVKGKPFIRHAYRQHELPQADIPAFPGAEGGGMYTFGGRGGRVLVVTNLNDEGPGSFRWACEQGGARVVVFNVAGIIRLERPIHIAAPYITIAGQTAPGDGVCITNETLAIDTHDVVIRHMRFRRNNDTLAHMDDCVGGNPVGNILLDHCSASWGSDENISIYRHMYNEGEGLVNELFKDKKYGTINVTIQNCISSEAYDTYNNSHGSTIGGENATFVRNLWSCNATRNPSIGWNGQFNLVNCVIHNWHDRSVDGGDYTATYNLINNYYKPGPATDTGTPGDYRILKLQTGRSKFPWKVYGRTYAAGNVMEGNERVTRDNWDGGIQLDPGVDLADYIDTIRWNRPMPMAPVRILSAEEAYAFVMDNAGATLPRRDAVDERIIRQARTNVIEYDRTVRPEDFFNASTRAMTPESYKQGIIVDMRQVGGLPEYRGTPRTDTDSDGMPDEWEKRYRLDPNDPSDAVGDLNGDGYTNIEKYINGIDPRKKIDWTDLKNNHDTLAERGL